MCKSRILKGFMLKYISTCFLTLIVSLRVQNGHLTISSFDDFTPTWFKGVGYNLLMAFFFKALLTPLVEFFLVLLAALKRFWDRKLSCDMSKTRTKTQLAYQKVYTDDPFELDFCYTDQINIIFICITLSAVLPLMIPVCFLNLLALYWKDKVISSHRSNQC